MLNEAKTDSVEGPLADPDRRKWTARSAGIGLVLVALLGVGVAGCTATAGVGGEVVYGYPVVTVETVPVEIAAYPRVYYRGRYAYLVDGRWYYPTARGWVVFREEPRELARYRVEHHRRGPRVYRGAEPAYRERRYRPD